VPEEGSTYRLTLSSPDAGNPITWVIDWDDGSSRQTLESSEASEFVDHVFLDGGTFTVKATAITQEDVFADSLSVEAVNVEPDLTAVNGPATVSEGDGYILTLGASDPGDDTIVSWQIDWGDGTSVTVQGFAETASHIYADDSANETDGVFRIVATATDEDDSYETLLDVAVENVAPTPLLDGIGTPVQLLAGPLPTAENTVAVNEGSSFVLQIAPPYDPGDDFVTEYMIDWGDGSAIQTLAVPVATATGGNSTTLVDDAATFVTDGIEVDALIRNLGEDVLVRVIAVVSETELTTEAVVDWNGDNYIFADEFVPTLNVNHVFADDSASTVNGLFQIAVTPTDEDGTFDKVAMLDVEVRNVAPVITGLSLDSTVVFANESIMISGAFIDPGTLDTHTVVIDWGDNTLDTTINVTPGQRSFTASHQYLPGASGMPQDIYTISTTVTDNGSGTGSATSTVTVMSNQAPVLGAIGNQEVDEGTELTFTASATDDDLPANGLTFSLDAGAPAGASIDSVSGAFSWTPNEADGPGMFSVTVRVTDDGTPNLDDFETIMITVNEVNVAPALGAIGNQEVDEGTELTFTASAMAGGCEHRSGEWCVQLDAD
jgi:hypothetical protein